MQYNLLSSFLQYIFAIFFPFHKYHLQQYSEPAMSKPPEKMKPSKLNFQLILISHSSLA